MQTKYLYMGIGALIISNIIAIDEATKPSPVAVCRGVVLNDIREGKQYQDTLDQMLRPDWVSEIEKAQPKKPAGG